MEIKVMSYNIRHCEHFITNQIDFDAVYDVIRMQKADIIGLNEVRGKGIRSDYQAQAEILAKKTGFYFYFAKAIDVRGKNPYGNALLSRYPIQNAETVPIPDPAVKTGIEAYETRCVLKATVAVNDGITVLVSHFGLNTDEQENAVKTVENLLTEQKCILMGDFNCTPKAPVLLPLRKKLSDTARAFSQPKMSFPADLPNKKIDYMFITRDIKVLTADIPVYTVSDHRPYTAVLSVN